MNKARLYYEAHITLDEGSDFDSFAKDCKSRRWKASKFDVDDVDNYHGKWFMSCRGAYEEKVCQKIRETVAWLEASGYTVVRAKVEDTIKDTKYGDVI